MRTFSEQLTAGPWLVKVFLRILAAVLAMLLLLILLPQSRPYVPVVISLAMPLPDGPEVAGSPVRSAAGGDVVLVVSHRDIAESARLDRFEDVLWSYAWLNLLEQEFGWPAVADLEDLGPGALEGRRVAILTRSATAGPPPPAALEEAGRFVRAGGALVLEMPGADWEPLSGVVLSDEAVNPSARVWRGAPVAWQALPPGLGTDRRAASPAALLDVPVSTWLKMALMMDSHVEAMGLLADQPALFSSRQGEGRVLTLAFDLGYQLQSLQQGAPPGPGWHVPEQGGLIPGLVESQDLVGDVALLDAPTPHADLLEAWMAGLLEDLAGPLPGWWRFPYPYDGVLAVSHDEEERGLVGFEAVFSLERRLDVRPTVFLLPEEDLGRRWPSRERDLELHWNRFLSARDDLPPYRSIPLAEQVAEVAAVRGSTPRLGRIHFLAWGPDYVQPFRRMAAAGLELDSTYGPNRARGYLFGTGLPFRVLDRNGLPLPIREWPFVAQEDWYGADAAWLEALLARSGAWQHQAPVVLYHPHKLLARPGGSELLGRVVAAARRHEHWVAPMIDYHDFRLMRERARIRSRVQGNLLRVEAEAPAGGLALRLPAGMAPARLDGAPARSRRIRLGERWFDLVEVPAGLHRVEFSIPPDPAP